MDRKSISRTTIKYIAVFFMTINHICYAFYPSGYLGLISNGSAAMAFPLFQMLLIEGYEKTSSKRKYFIRLLVMAIASQAPFYFYFRQPRLNVGFSLLVVFIICYVKEKCQSQYIFTFTCIILFAASFFLDNDFLVVIPTVILLSQRIPLKFKYALCVIYGMIYRFAGLYVFSGAPLFNAVAVALMTPIPYILYCFAYSSDKTGRKNSFTKHFFYIYYPLHLAVLYVSAILYYL